MECISGQCELTKVTNLSAREDRSDGDLIALENEVAFKRVVALA